MFYIENPPEGKSFTRTMFFIAFNAGLAKLLLSGITIGSFKFETFGGADFAAVIAAGGSIYSFGKYLDKDKKEEKNDEKTP